MAEAGAGYADARPKGYGLSDPWQHRHEAPEGRCRSQADRGHRVGQARGVPRIAEHHRTAGGNDGLSQLLDAWSAAHPVPPASRGG